MKGLQNGLAVDKARDLARQVSIVERGRRRAVEHQRGKIAFLAGQNIADEGQARGGGQR